MAITQIGNLVPAALPSYGGAAPIIQPVDSVGEFDRGSNLAQKMILQPSAILAAKTSFQNQAGQAQGEMDLRPAELALKKKQLAAETSDLDATTARQTYVKQQALDLQGLMLDAQKALFPGVTQPTIAAQGQTGLNNAQLDLSVSQGRLSRAKDASDTAAAEIANTSAKVAVETAQLARLKNDPTGLRDQLGKYLIELGEPYDPNDSAPNLFAKYQRARNEQIDMMNRMALIKVGAGQSAGLRKEYMDSKIKEKYETVIDGYGQIKDSANKPDDQTTPADDLKSVYAYMKMIDPGSIVRPSQYQEVENARNIPDNAKQWFKRLFVDGTKLDPIQRKQLLDSAAQVADLQKTKFDNLRGFYSRTATRLSIDPQTVVGDVQDQKASDEEAKPATSQARAAVEPSGRAKVKLRDGSWVYGNYTTNPKTGVREFIAE